MEVQISKRALKSLHKVPKQVAINFFLWKREVEEHGIEVTRRIPGYHDEPLAGSLRGHVRSVRLGIGYRAFYRITQTGVKCIFVEEVNKHDYKAIKRLCGL